MKFLAVILLLFLLSSCSDFSQENPDPPSGANYEIISFTGGEKIMRVCDSTLKKVFYYRINNERKVEKIDTFIFYGIEIKKNKVDTVSKDTIKK